MVDAGCTRDAPRHHQNSNPIYGLKIGFDCYQSIIFIRGWADLLGSSPEQSEGWFDLRIKLADEVGNKQTVVVSPAFKISELTGIEKVVFDKVDVRVEGNNIIAPDKAMIYNAAGMRVGRKSLPRGVYMVVSDGRTTKCVVR